MAKAIMETSLYTNLNISTDEIVQASVDTSVDTSGAHRVQYMEKQKCVMNKLEEDIPEYYIRLGEMKARVAEVQDDMKEEYLSQLENLENIGNMFSLKYRTLKKSSGDVWEDLKVAIEEAWSELEF